MGGFIKSSNSRRSAFRKREVYWLYVEWLRNVLERRSWAF